MQVALDAKVSDYVDPHMYSCDAKISVVNAVKEMVAEKLDSVIVMEDNNVAGIVTNADILEKVVAKGRDPTTVTLGDIKSYPAMEIHKDANILEAISIMNNHDIRRLLVKNGSQLVGMITRKQIVGSMGKHRVALPELETPHHIKCPYCESIFADKQDLSKHIDDIHIGKGLLEGNLNQEYA